MALPAPLCSAWPFLQPIYTERTRPGNAQILTFSFNFSCNKCCVSHHPLQFLFSLFPFRLRRVMTYICHIFHSVLVGETKGNFLRMPPSGMWHRVDLVWPDVLEERIASIFKVEKSASEEPTWAGGCSLHTLRVQRCRDCGRWTLPCHTIPISHGSTAISEKKKSLAFLLYLYLYFPNILTNLRILFYNSSLVTWTVVSLTAAKFKPHTVSMYGFALSCAANNQQLKAKVTLRLVVYRQFSSSWRQATWDSRPEIFFNWTKSSRYIAPA
jgi:hypothetical protein